jgi:hypothetical protein
MNRSTKLSMSHAALAIAALSLAFAACGGEADQGQDQDQSQGQGQGQGQSQGEDPAADQDGAGSPGAAEGPTSSNADSSGEEAIPEPTYEVGPGKSYATLDEVAPLLAPGDVVTVQGDHTYPGGVILENSGTEAAKIRIFGVRVNGKRPRFEGGNNTIEIRASYNLIQGLDVTGGSSRCIYHHGHENTVRDTVVHDCPQQGILGGDYDTGSLTLDYVEVYGCGADQYQHQIYMSNDQSVYPGSVFRMQHCYVHDGNGGNNVKSRASKNEIYYNWIEGALYHELELIGPEGQDPSVVREDSDVVGNVIKKQGNHFAVRVGGDSSDGESNGRYRFTNNTFLLKQGSNSVFRLYEGIESIEMHNNVFYRVGGGGVEVMDSSEANWATGHEVIAGSKNWVASGSSEIPSQWSDTVTGGDPSFVNLEADDLKPASGSALVNAGAAATASPPGFEFPSPLALPLELPPPGAIQAVGTALPRPVAGAVDIGAYEMRRRLAFRRRSLSTASVP